MNFMSPVAMNGKVLGLVTTPQQSFLISFLGCCLRRVIVTAAALRDTVT